MSRRALLTLALAAPATMKDLIFLTRDGCVNTPDVVNNLDDALKALKLPNDCQYINIGKLPKDDPRTGYPTPTILWKRNDIFGMSAPKPPYNVPSRRVSKGVVPSIEEFQKRLKAPMR